MVNIKLERNIRNNIEDSYKNLFLVSATSHQNELNSVTINSYYFLSLFCSLKVFSNCVAQYVLQHGTTYRRYNSKLSSLETDVSAKKDFFD